MVKVKLINTTDFTQYVDLVGDNDPDTIIALGPRSNTTGDVASEAQFVKLSKSLRGKVVIRKL